MPAIESPSILILSVAALVAYFIGALPFAYGVGKTRGVNIFDVGSGQAGAPKGGAPFFFAGPGR